MFYNTINVQLTKISMGLIFLQRQIANLLKSLNSTSNHEKRKQNGKIFNVSAGYPETSREPWEDCVRKKFLGDRLYPTVKVYSCRFLTF